MNRYEIIKNKFYQTIEDKSYGLYRMEGYFHSIQVSALCKQEALTRKLDIELAGIIGLFHDFSTYVYQNSFQHAFQSSELTKKILIESQLFNQDELTLIITAIKNHSDKDRIDDEYSELIKDVDVLIHYLDDQNHLFDEISQKRLSQYKTDTVK